MHTITIMHTITVIANLKVPQVCNSSECVCVCVSAHVFLSRWDFILDAHMGARVTVGT